MNTISNKGFIFTTDLIITIILLLFCLLAFALTIGSQINFLEEREKSLFLEEKIIFIADSFVKNFDEENALLGACKIDLEKKRVLSNELNSASFSNIKQIKSEKIFIKNIIIGEKVIFSDSKTAKNCFSVKRFVLVDGIKKIIFMNGCLNE